MRVLVVERVFSTVEEEFQMRIVHQLLKLVFIAALAIQPGCSDPPKSADTVAARPVVGDRQARTVTYCGGGIAAAADAFVLTRLGFTDVAIYAASLEEWTANPDNPMEVKLEDME